MARKQIRVGRVRSPLASSVRAYRHYLEHGLESDLLEYGFWLEHRRAITEVETLPELEL
ncbi:hypothetical protein [Nocardia acidivorans]|uniref:hypothetical protein n=1 Tax=Nocardia acidivorans TaxID=404580 RepID=UPI000A91D751|nr:hypothetical protein [Nocardia acidivorans]